MNNIFLYIFSIIIIGFIFYINYKESEEKAELPYKKKEWLMTKAEIEFYNVLKQVAGDRYYIIPQVKISSLVYVSGTKNYKTYLNKIDRKTIDFVLFNSQFSPIIAIELDDSSHNNLSRKERDDFVDKVMNAISLKIVHIKASYNYNLEEINKLISL
jgi:hypothetical protein